MSQIGQRVVTGFLIPAVEAVDHHELWKAVNRGAGVIAGHVFAVSETPVEAVELAQQVVFEVIGLLRQAKPAAADQRNVDMILGLKGLQPRLQECLQALIC